ncbi:helix-turn-helix transcriptional regulator [Streptomyces roseirectus]|uniref:Helix-turn-helix transcriptional regulator n=1 Tax=Streptomyces roseirectus TaxID=2768066 RepID=A0A7H0IG16_9ACTN|nr:helix-turn-helix transcriptional regulator [Streptomyces roseirectus]QNP71732.1 helix-turn-helix transcriptional regulator [Streptomyces roseirectus]
MSRRLPVTGKSQEPRERFRQVIKELREARGLNFRQLADRLGWDKSLLSRLESGATIGSAQVAMGLDTFYGTTPFILTLWELAIADAAQFRPKYQQYMKYEAQALALWHYGVIRPPGLLQTEGYAREALAAGGFVGEELERQIDARVGRQAVLLGEGAPDFRTILSEAVLRNSLRDPAAWREQLEHLLEVSELPNVTIQVLPFGSGQHGLVNTDMMFLKLADGRTVAYTENDVRGDLFEEPSMVRGLNRAYDSVRDLAKNPVESRQIIMRMLEDVPCEPST